MRTGAFNFLPVNYPPIQQDQVVHQTTQLQSHQHIHLPQQQLQPQQQQQQQWTTQHHQFTSRPSVIPQYHQQQIQQQQQHHPQQQHLMMIQSQSSGGGHVQSVMGMQPQIRPPVMGGNGFSQPRFQTMQSIQPVSSTQSIQPVPIQVMQQHQQKQNAEITWNTPTYIPVSGSYGMHNQQPVQQKQHQHRQLQQEPKPRSIQYQVNEQDLFKQQVSQKSQKDVQPSDNRNRDIRENPDQREIESKKREREYQDRLNRERESRERDNRERESRERDNRERESRERENRERGRDKNDREYREREYPVRDGQGRNRQRDRDVDIQPSPTTSILLSSSVPLVSLPTLSISHSGKPPLSNITLLERSVNDLTFLYPKLWLPQNLTHCIANWTRTFPVSFPRRIHSIGMSPLESVSTSLEGLEASTTFESHYTNTFSHPILNSRVTRIVLDNDRKSVHQNGTTIISEENIAGSLIESPVDAIISISKKIPVKFSTRVVMLSNPQNTNDSTATKLNEGLNRTFFIPNETCLLLRQNSSKYQLLGGSYDVSIDKSNDEECDGPYLDDTCLIKCASRHVRSQCGVDLSECKNWVKFLQLHYHRPDTTVTDIDDESNPRTVVTPEHIEVVSIFIVLDLWKAVHLYKLERNEHSSFWVNATTKLSETVNDNTSVSLEKSTLTSSAVSQMSVRELKSLLSQRGLDTKGKKDELVVRLLEASNDDDQKKGREETLKAENKFKSSSQLPLDFEPPKVPCLLVIAPLRGVTTIEYKIVPLDSLLQYSETDHHNEEESFEVLLVAESLLELFQRDSAVTIVSALTMSMNVENETSNLSSDKDDSRKKRRLNNSAEHIISTAEILCAFRMFDKDGTGYVAVSDIEKVISNTGLRLSREDIKSLLSNVSEKKRFAYSEFMQ